MIRGFDISENNADETGLVPEDLFDEAANAGCKFVYVRASWGNGHEDTCFRDSVEKAHARGFKVGAYHYDYGLTPDDAARQAQQCADIIDRAGVMLELPVFYDMEDTDKWKQNHGFDFNASNVTAMCQAWLDSIGLNSGVYASYSWLQNRIDWQGLGCPIWNAEWGDADDLGGYVWQDTEQLWLGNHSVDGDWMYDESVFQD
ncbi:MAG: hypothetical protein MSA50_08465 [Veillonellaceae bacterium]|nr:hypothetical protein [Veillonellaceae bacterium]